MQLEDPTRHDLIRYLRKHSIKIAPPDQPFRLASGGTSTVFCDMKQTLLQPHGAYIVASLLLDTIGEYELRHTKIFDAVAGVVLGGCPIASAVSNVGFLERSLQLPVLYVRKEPKDHGTAKLIEGEVTQGMRVALLEDVTTTGGSAAGALVALRNAGAVVPVVFSVVDRSKGDAKHAFGQNGCDYQALCTLDELT